MSEPRIEYDELVHYLRGIAWIQHEGLFDNPSPELRAAMAQARRALEVREERSGPAE